MSRNDVQSELLADLQDASQARPLPPSAPSAPLRPALPREPLRPPTPAFDLRVTPLRWSWPGFAPAPTGLGLGLRAGPVQISLSVGS